MVNYQSNLVIFSLDMIKFILFICVISLLLIMFSHKETGKDMGNFGGVETYIENTRASAVNYIQGYIQKARALADQYIRKAKDD